MRDAYENQCYAHRLMRDMPWPGRIWADLFGACEPFIIQELRRGLFDRWETLYPMDARSEDWPYPLLFATITEARQALAEIAGAGSRGVYRVAGYHTKAEYDQVRF